MQIICTSLQTDNHASTSPLGFTGWMPFLLPNQQRQSTEGTGNITNKRQTTHELQDKTAHIPKSFMTRRQGIMMFQSQMSRQQKSFTKLAVAKMTNVFL